MNQDNQITKKKEYRRKYYLANKEKITAINDKYYQTHKERLLSKRREWDKNHPKKIKESHKKSYENNKETYSKRMAKQRSDWRIMVIGHLGGVCCRCGFSDIRALQIDHINGNGNQERKQFCSNSPAFYTKVLNDKGENYQLLCANCNWIKRSENGEFRSLKNIK